MSEPSSPDFDVYFDTIKNRIEVDDLRVHGGNISITGAVTNTANGKIEVLGGYGNVTINNNTAFAIQVNRVDVSQRGQGTLYINDTSSLVAAATAAHPYNISDPGIGKLTIYQVQADGTVQVNGVTQTPAQLAALTYTPSDWRYAWTVGVNDSIHYSNHQTSSSWAGIINLGTDSTQYNTTTPQGVPVLEGSGPYFYLSPTHDKTAYEYTQTTLNASSVVGPSASSSSTTWYGETTVTVDSYLDVGQHILNTHDIAASRGIGIQFFGHTTGAVTINSTDSGSKYADGGDVYLDGAILNPTGTTTITTGNAIVEDNAAASVGGERVVLSAAKGIGSSAAAVQVNVTQYAPATAAIAAQPQTANHAATPAIPAFAGSAEGSLSATTTKGDVDLVQAIGNLPVDTVLSSSLGAVNLTANGGITVANKPGGGSYAGLVSGGAITLTASTGGIGNGTGTPLILDTPLIPGQTAPLSDRLTGIAHGDIFVQEKSGDLRVNTLASTNGNVWVNVPTGSLIDANTNTVEDTRTEQELLAGVWKDLGLTAQSGYDAKVQATLDSYIASKTSDYQTYWTDRHMQADGGATYDSAFQVTLSAAELAYYQGTLGYSASSIQTLVNTRTAEYHTLNATYGVGGTYAAQSPGFNANSFDGAFKYNPTQAEKDTLKATQHEWTESELLYGIGAGLLKEVTDTVVNIESPAITGNQVTLLTSGSIGQSGNNIAIDVSTTPINLSDADRIALAAAERTDVQFLSAPLQTATVNFVSSNNTIVRTDGGTWTGISAGQVITIGDATPAPGQPASHTQNATTSTVFYKVVSVSGGTITINAATPLKNEVAKQITLAPVVTDPSFAASAPAVSATVSFTTNTLTSGGTIVRATGSFVADGFAAGQLLTVAGSPDNSTSGITTYSIVSVSATTITLATNARIIAETGVVVQLTRGYAPNVTTILVSQLHDVNIAATGAVKAVAGSSILLGSNANLAFGAGAGGRHAHRQPGAHQGLRQHHRQFGRRQCGCALE